MIGKTIIFFLSILLFNFCSLNDSTAEKNPPSESLLALVSEVKTEVSEPSGLTLGKNNWCLWTVSDNTNHVYKLSLNGTVLEELKFQGDDLEGITYDKRDGSLWVAEEQLRQLVHLDTLGNELGRFDVTNLEGSGNSGLEGVCISDSIFYVLNEKNPRLWAELNKDFEADKVKEIADVDDLSGIFCALDTNSFWIVSDQSRKVFIWNPEKGMIKSQDLGYSKAEGIAVDLVRNKVYIVSDETWKLYVYNIIFK